MSNSINRPLLRFIQIGDLHLTEQALQNHRDFIRIVHELNRQVDGSVDFVYLPGDNADDGTDEQFDLVCGGLNELRLPWRAIPGDHDFKPRSLESFYRALRVRRLPSAEEIGGHLCLFLDVVSQGTGGPDFKLGTEQFEWIKDRLADAQRDGKACVVFMHAYPADLGGEAERLSQLFDESSVRLVAMGHTHYNEIAHDGRTVYAATRSTGQIEEGPVGFSFAALDGDVVSWRFKPLDSPWPFVMITAPADRRLDLQGTEPEPARLVRACAWGTAPVSSAEFRIDDGPWRQMSREDHCIFVAPIIVGQQPFRLEVRVTDETGATADDVIECETNDLRRASTGSDAGSIGAWPERHLFGTQLGPNRNGRKW
ncbi:calcineurin-like phosphoesterase family protein [Bradyrhizobium macuxiense]|uniref:Calcineurin-like phosphoesterase family protein n=1 Tax=Bradyrhizobium macuxiense TaxID=1755647 RepID=A0A560L526_9BRAD|nr:metallophosphoesterase [Bradyrhizobium macuxiense]TWB90641.1 calcineurin-like phosphoesterase family protein [Bradyrhizobium macuxiense]